MPQMCVCVCGFMDVCGCMDVCVYGYMDVDVWMYGCGYGCGCMDAEVWMRMYVICARVCICMYMCDYALIVNYDM